MPGLYSITTRSDGEVLSASKYNTDHQNHVDNQTPQMTDDYSASVAEMQTATDTGNVGSESLATTLAGEIARLRYAIKEIKTSLNAGSAPAQWYSKGGASGGYRVRGVYSYASGTSGLVSPANGVDTTLITVNFTPTQSTSNIRLTGSLFGYANCNVDQLNVTMAIKHTAGTGAPATVASDAVVGQSVTDVTIAPLAMTTFGIRANCTGAQTFTLVVTPTTAATGNIGIVTARLLVEEVG